ncbi:M24 family metallopeptidase [Microbacterium halophytorum]|uniref:M24 family metallopeptidase n=1 Tax=Microbacterium halophytorum TaxID=2067568 RepID=UPI000CFC883D|nr:M24 family metallopeptidase [Microbacterium halophytorum]
MAVSIEVDAGDRPAKLRRVASVLEQRGAGAVVLATPASLAWLFEGARTGVPLGGAPVLSALVDRDGRVAITTLANEVDRLAAEEIGGDVDWRVVPWHASLGDIPDGAVAEEEIAGELRAARASLLPAELDRYRSLGADTAAAVTRVLGEARPDWSERTLASRLAAASYDIGAEPSVVLVAGASRSRVQHPIPTDAPLGDRALAVVTTVRRGLHASMSRWVAFSDDQANTDAEARLREVEADVFAAARPGRGYDDVFRDIRAAYAANGFGRDAWARHHQGGPTGYAGRDPKLAPDSVGTVAERQAFAFNPWVPGAKLEDTIITSSAGVEVLTRDPVWPTADVRGLPRPLPLTRA